MNVQKLRTGTLILLMALSIGASAAFGQSSTSNVQGRASVNIVGGLSLVNNRGLNFGDIAASSTLLGTVVVSATGVRSATGGPTPAGGTVNSAQFTVARNSGGGSVNYTIVLPASIVIANGANSMTVDTFTSDKAANKGQMTGNGQNKTDTFQVGATLHVAAAQAVGLYTGTFNVTVTQP